MGDKRKVKKASQKAPPVETEKDVDDGFTVVSSKQKSKQPDWKIKVKQADLDISSADVEHTNGDLSADAWKSKTPIAEPVPPRTPSPIYHPDFATIRSPSDVLFKTADGIIFWFSLSLLSHHSPRFALLDPLTLWLRQQPLDFSSVVTVVDLDSRSFAIVAHTLLHNYEGVQKAIHLEEATIVDMPSDIVDAGVVGALRHAITFAKTFEIDCFISMATSLIAPHVDQFLSLQTYHEYDTGSQMKEILGM